MSYLCDLLEGFASSHFGWIDSACMQPVIDIAVRMLHSPMRMFMQRQHGTCAVFQPRAHQSLWLDAMDIWHSMLSDLLCNINNTQSQSPHELKSIVCPEWRAENGMLIEISLKYYTHIVIRAFFTHSRRKYSGATDFRANMFLQKVMSERVTFLHVATKPRESKRTAQKNSKLILMYINRTEKGGRSKAVLIKNESSKGVGALVIPPHERATWIILQ